MSIKSNYRKQIESYLSGEMQGTDRLVFEGHVASNPTLREEFEVQNQIVESLKEQRKAELKTRLNGIVVEPTLIGGLLQASLVKPLVYAITGLSIVASSYVYLGIIDEDHSHHLSSIEHKSNYIIDEHINLDDLPKLTYRYQSEPEQFPTTFKPESVPSTKQIKDQSVTKQIRFVVPDINEQISKDDFVANSMSDFEGAKGIDKVSSLSKIDKVNIQTIHSIRYDFHYRMEDNRLYLYGKFGDSPYEIIEINSPGNKKLFFYYNSSFYELKKNASSVTPLSEIQNQSMVEKLLAIKNNTNK